MSTEKVAFEIISLSGDAKSELQKALKLVHEGTFEKAQELIVKANEHLRKAHEMQTQELLMREANGEKLSFNVLISHAQDYLMTTYIFKDMVEEIITLYKVIKNK
ncbi:MAG: PTS lactose/cellobiose transporter subunit IIA [Megamonas funiformis]|uniref:PTS lactose/cellobiose transporter subunit IIA n=1 Tax=Megamonas funiformis TaxID=437897 RepID=UPI002A7F8306|nr:PTS lactose/cellobiose transporter subunit IIA [Megamonas funiformis]MDY3875078.1 PTS lactose/cellobiose transporter subunit IIA [Megamonas funiformis]